eukprot:TRINITY_DN27058_c0_g1_i1.p1 TRINITY_DN27058_c0_g1~~TRINITY_DN27058_c0_g1_i1.p1  ORF type:complete len:444 (-),score=83.79 TRINITY_DN27058_c0_g1_i1:169-1365(-)
MAVGRVFPDNSKRTVYQPSIHASDASLQRKSAVSRSLSEMLAKMTLSEFMKPQKPPDDRVFRLQYYEGDYSPRSGRTGAAGGSVGADEGVGMPLSAEQVQGILEFVQTSSTGQSEEARATGVSWLAGELKLIAAPDTTEKHEFLEPSVRIITPRPPEDEQQVHRRRKHGSGTLRRNSSTGSLQRKAQGSEGFGSSACSSSAASASGLESLVSQALQHQVITSDGQSTPSASPTKMSRQTTPAGATIFERRTHHPPPMLRRSNSTGSIQQQRATPASRPHAASAVPSASALNRPPTPLRRATSSGALQSVGSSTPIVAERVCWNNLPPRPGTPASATDSMTPRPASAGCITPASVCSRKRQLGRNSDASGMVRVPVISALSRSRSHTALTATSTATEEI